MPNNFPNQTHASQHFSWAELEATHAPADIKANLVKWCQLIGEPLRAKYGKPVNITSGWRDTKQQAVLWKQALAKYGSEAKARLHVAKPGTSQHEFGTACDFWIAGVSPKALGEVCAKLKGVGGVGVYESWVHADTRPLGPDGMVDRW